MARAAKTGAVAVKGLKELQRAFKRFDRDLIGDLTMELQEAADPVRKLTEQYIVGGGGGFPKMRNVDEWHAGMRIGVSSRGSVYVAPSWSSNHGTLQGAILALQIRFRMEGALEDKGKDIEKRLGEMIDRLSDAWGEGG